MGNLFAVGCDPCQWRRGSWWLRSSVAGFKCSRSDQHSTLAPYSSRREVKSSMARLDQSASHAELIIFVCPSIDVLQTFDIPPGFFFVLFFFLQITDTPTFPYRYIYIKRWLRVNQYSISEYRFFVSSWCLSYSKSV